jgi:hypothetical protein
MNALPVNARTDGKRMGMSPGRPMDHYLMNFGPWTADIFARRGSQTGKGFTGADVALR